MLHRELFEFAREVRCIEFSVDLAAAAAALSVPDRLGLGIQIRIYKAKGPAVCLRGTHELLSNAMGQRPGRWPYVVYRGVFPGILPGLGKWMARWAAGVRSDTRHEFSAGTLCRRQADFDLRSTTRSTTTVPCRKNGPRAAGVRSDTRQEFSAGTLCRRQADFDLRSTTRSTTTVPCRKNGPRAAGVRSDTRQEFSAGMLRRAACSLGLRFEVHHSFYNTRALPDKRTKGPAAETITGRRSSSLPSSGGTPGNWIEGSTEGQRPG